MKERTVIMTIEPSKRLSELCGFPYYIEKRVPLKDLIKYRRVTSEDIKEMEQGKQICISIPVVKE